MPKDPFNSNEEVKLAYNSLNWCVLVQQSASKSVSKKNQPVLRSYHDESTASHPNCEVKHRWARSVLQLGTMRESRVL